MSSRLPLSARCSAPTAVRYARPVVRRVQPTQGASMGFPDLFEALFSWGGANSDATETAWRPPVEILESETAWLLSMELPGVASEAVSVNFAEGKLTISGEKSAPEFAEGVEQRRSELARGKFERVFELPDHIEPEGIQARFSQGVLNVEIPKGIPGPEGRVIPITE